MLQGASLYHNIILRKDSNNRQLPMPFPRPATSLSPPQSTRDLELNQRGLLMPTKFPAMFDDTFAADDDAAQDTTNDPIDINEKSSTLISETELCGVCEAPAARHYHYGATTCFSCRAFFRRSVRTMEEKPYKCRKSNDCVILLQSRKNCQRCRFDKCISIGMKPGWVLSDEDRAKRFRKNRQKKKQNQNGEGGVEKPVEHAVQKTETFETRDNLIAEPCGPQHIYPEDNSYSQTTCVSPDYYPQSADAEKCRPRLPKFERKATSTMTSGLFEKETEIISPAIPALIPVKNGHPIECQPAKRRFLQVYNDELNREPAKKVQLLAEPNPLKPPPLIHRPSPTPPEQSQDSIYTSFNQILPRAFENVTATNQGIFIPDYDNGSRQLSFDTTNSPRNYPVYTSAAADAVEPEQEVDKPLDMSKKVGERQPPLPPLSPLLPHRTETEIALIDELAMTHDMSYKSISFGESVIREMIMCSVFGIPISMTTSMTAYRIMMQRVTRVAQNFSEFNSLAHQTQAALLKHNSDMIVSLRGAVFFETKKKGLDQILISLGVDDLKSAKELISATTKTRATLNRINYEAFNSIQVKDSESRLEAVYDKLQAKVGTTLAFNANLVKLLSFILLFSHDFDDPQVDPYERRRVQMIQDNMISMLTRYLIAKYPPGVAEALASGIMNCTSYLREMIWIKKQRALARPEQTS